MVCWHCSGFLRFVSGHYAARAAGFAGKGGPVRGKTGGGSHQRRGTDRFHNLARKQSAPGPGYCGEGPQTGDGRNGADSPYQHHSV